MAGTRPDDLEIKAFKLTKLSVDDDEGTFTGYASVFGNVDSYNEVVDKGAFKKSLKENSEVPVLWQHNPDEPIGVTLEASEDRTGLAVKGQLVLSVQRAKEARDLLSVGALKGLSIGFQTIKDEIVDNVRHLKELKLWEYSVVTFPANTRAGVAAVKSRRNLDLLDELRSLTVEIAESGRYDLTEVANEFRSLALSMDDGRAELDLLMDEIRSFSVGRKDAEPQEALRELVNDMKSTIRKGA